MLLIQANGKMIKNMVLADQLMKMELLQKDFFKMINSYKLNIKKIKNN